MERYEEIEKGIETKDVKRLREAIGTLIYTDRNFSRGVFDEAVQYVEEKGIKLKDDSLVGAPAISTIKDNYTEDDFTRAVYELKKNFCEERIEDVKTIGLALYGKKQDIPEPPVPKTSKKKIIVTLVIVVVIIVLLIKILK